MDAIRKEGRSHAVTNESWADLLTGFQCVGKEHPTQGAKSCTRGQCGSTKAVGLQITLAQRDSNQLYCD